MKRSLWLLSLLLLCVLVFAACDDDRSVAPTSDVAKDAIADQTITEEEAIAIALDHAGLTEAEVTGLYVHLDRDDGKEFYDISFRQDRMEYDYEINSTNGYIIDFDKEID